MSIEQELIAVTEERLAAFKAVDLQRLGDLLADDTTYVSVTGRILRKSEVLAELQSGAMKVTSYQLSDFDVKTYGETAVVTYRAVMSIAHATALRAAPVRVMSVCVKIAGRWRLVAQQMTVDASLATRQQGPQAVPDSRPMSSPQITH